MPSITEFQKKPSVAHNANFGRNQESRSDRLAAFRVRADVQYERSLSKLIESEIIPRLMVAHMGDSGPVGEHAGASTISAAEVEAFAPMTLQIEADTLLDHVERLLHRGVSVETVLIDLLAPAARILGEFWEDDRCDFVDVTMGLWRLQEVVHELAARLPADRQSSERRALFAAMPGDHHSFGAVVVDELFCRAGWITDRLSEAETADLVARVSSEWFDLVGLTISLDCHIGALPSVIVALRNASRNPQLCVMVGGRIFVRDPALAAQVGADGTASDAKLAVKVAAGLVNAVEREPIDCG
ncbi:cobalamin-binding protein [Sphingomonas koreensis]|nr:cobalamin-binding protein [Sphingomonas koreensis]